MCSYGVVQTRYQKFNHSHAIQVSRKFAKFDCFYTYIIIFVLVVEALRYKSDGRGFDSIWCHGNFSLIHSSWPHYGLVVDSASNRNEYQDYIMGDKGGRCVGLTALPLSCADCLEICEPRPPGNLRACPGL